MPTQEKAKMDPLDAETFTPPVSPRRLRKSGTPDFDNEARMRVPNDLLHPSKGPSAEPPAPGYDEGLKKPGVRGRGGS